MSKKPRGSRALTIVFALLGAVLIIAILWGIVTGIAKLMHYGEHATIQQEPEPETQEEAPAEEPQPEEALPKNTFNTDGFYELDGIRYYHGGDLVGVAGVDVSAYQTSVDWSAVKEAGIDFAMVRVGYRGYSSGELDEDDYFLSHLEGAIEAGLHVGVYFFSQALTPDEAREEAQYVLDKIEGYALQYPVVFDWEEMHVPARTDEMNMLMLTSCAQAFCETVEAAGYRAGVYFNQAYGYGQLNLVSLKDYVFWLAEYADTPSFSYDFQIWQYTNEGQVPGIEGPVDLNIAFHQKDQQP